MLVHDPGNKAPIRKLYAFLSKDKEGNEGIMGADLGNGTVPLITANTNLVSYIRNYLAANEELLNSSPKEIYLIEFYRGDLEEKIK